MQLESQCVRIQLQEYRSNKFVKGTCKEFRVYNVPVDDLMNLIKLSVQRAAEPQPTPIPKVIVAKASVPRNPVTGRRQLSAESKKRISDAQKLKWLTRDRKLSPEVKDKISESQRQRWARRNKNWAEMRTNPIGDGASVMFAGSV